MPLSPLMAFLCEEKINDVSRDRTRHFDSHKDEQPQDSAALSDRAVLIATRTGNKRLCSFQDGCSHNSQLDYRNVELLCVLSRGARRRRFTRCSGINVCQDLSGSHTQRAKLEQGLSFVKE